MSYLSKIRSRLTPAQREVFDRKMSRKSRRTIHARGGGDVRRSTTPRQATATEKARYASRARYVPRPTTGTAGVPSWTKNYARVNGNKVYRQYNTQTFYYQRGNTVYRHDRRNNRYYLLDNGVMSGGVVVPYSRVPQWVLKTAKKVSS